MESCKGVWQAMSTCISVAFIFHDTDFYSGATRSLMDLIDNIDRSKIQVYAIVPHREGSLVDRLTDRNIPIIYAPYHGNTYYLSESKVQRILKYAKRRMNGIMDLVCGMYLGRIVEKLDIDIIYTNTCTLYIGTLIKRLKKHVRHIWHIREYAEEDHNIGLFGGRTKFYNELNSYTDDVIFISNSLAEKYAPYIYAPEIHIIYDDLSKGYIQNAFDEYHPHTPLYVLICGNICPNKGQIQAVKAVHQLVLDNIPVHLFVAGGITDRKYDADIHEYISNNHLEQYISFMGRVEDMNSVRRKTKFTITASKSEAFGRTTIESMLSGHYVIGAESAATAELIQDGTTGRLYGYGNAEEIAGILADAFNDAAKVNQICHKGFEYALKFTEGACAKAVGKILLK